MLADVKRKSLMIASTIVTVLQLIFSLAAILSAMSWKNIRSFRMQRKSDISWQPLCLPFWESA